jgi:CheY-like chemotaxis protein
MKEYSHPFRVLQITVPWILILDDSARIGQVLQQGLTRFGWQIQTFTTPKMALAFLRCQLKPLVAVILDLYLADGRVGISVAREIRKHELYRSVSLLLMTTHLKTGVWTQAYQAGINDYVFKEPDLVEQIVRKLTPTAPLQPPSTQTPGGKPE